MRGEANLDFLRLQQINDTLGMPLVIHGGTGLSDEQFQQLISCGVSKINYYTSLADKAGLQIRDNANTNPQHGYTALTTGVKDIISAEVERCIRLWGSASRATELLTQCTPWMPVELLIVYNVDGITEHQANTMMDEGRKILSSIPGVLEVVTGRAIQHDAMYRYTWLIRFCHSAVIESYRTHPEHVAFADTLF